MSFLGRGARAARSHRRLLRLGDLLADVAIELRARMPRTVLMVMAVSLSTGALLASVGISRNAARQIDADLAASTVNLVTVTLSSAADAARNEAADAEKPQSAQQPNGKAAPRGGNPLAGSGAPNVLLPDDADQRVARIATVRAAGRKLTVGNVPSVKVERALIGVSASQIKVTGVTPGYLDANEIAATGDQRWMLDGSEHIAFLGQEAAKKLGVPVTSDLRGVSVDLNGVNYSIAGFLKGKNTLSDDVVIPYRSALAMAGGDKETSILVRTAPGAGSQVSRAVRLAILPQSPEKLVASQVASVDRLRENASEQLARQATWVGAFLIVLTVLLIANSMVVSVTARTVEIGVRRALGSSRMSVASVFWCEGAVTGFLGGLAGSAVAAASIVAVAAFSGWTAHIDPQWIALGPLLGTVVGVVASAYPALRASGIRPAIAVRSD